MFLFLFFYWKDFHIGFVFCNSFNVFLFEFAYCLKMVLFKAINASFHVHNKNILKSFLTCKYRWIFVKSFSIVYSSCPYFSNSQYLLAFPRRWRYFMIGSSISCFIDMNFVLSATTNIFLGLIFLLRIWLIFSKVRSSKFVGYAMVKLFIIGSHPAVAKKRSIILFSPPFSLLSFSFLVLTLAAKRSDISTKSESSRDNWYPIGDAIVVMWTVSTG